MATMDFFEHQGLTTAADALARWDAGATIWSVEMGGLGPGYEQVIQVMAFEIIRMLVASQLPEDTDAAWSNRMSIIRDALMTHPVVQALSPSGAQVGAALNLAAIVTRQGYARALAVPEIQDRLIQVSKTFAGRAPAPALPTTTTPSVVEGYRPINVEDV